MNLLQDLDPGLSGLEQLRALTASGRQVPIGETMGFTLAKIEEGFAVFEGTPGVVSPDLISVSSSEAITSAERAFAQEVGSRLRR